MTIAKRIIVSLLHDGEGNCYKPRAFSRPARPVGSLIQSIQVMEQRQIDELCLLNIGFQDGASMEEPEYLRKLNNYAKELSCPLSIGGGIRRLDHVKLAIDNGADKIVFSNRFETYQVVSDASKLIGSSSVILNLIYNSNVSTLAVFKMCARAVDMGVGEIILTNAARDGTMVGYDLETIGLVSSKIPIPVVANAGCSSPQNMDAALKCGADAVMASSLFLFTDTTPRGASKFLQTKGHEVRVT